MYPVSEAFLRAVQENTRRYYWTGEIRTKGGAVYPFGCGDIVKGSGYVAAQCCGSAEIELGTVYAAEMGISLFSRIDRRTLEGAEVRLSYHLRLADGSFEEVPMGVFEVGEANRTARCLELKAYDYMLRFEKGFNGFQTAGNAYAFLDLCCRACGVELAHTKDEVEAMPNGAELLSVYPENDIETYRDVLYFVGQVLGGFFCINREGKLELRKYGAEPVMELGSRQRFGSSFSDFVTRYTAVSSTNLRTQTAEYYALETDDGLTMNLGVNPLLQFGVAETREGLCRNILQDVAAVNYVPFDSETIGNPALDLGDVLKFSGGQADAGQLSVVTSMQVKVGGKHRLKGVGKNPGLARAKSKSDKNISGLLNQIAENRAAGRVGIHTFTNASAFKVSGTDVKIITIEFATSEDNHAQFFGSVIVDVEADAVERSAVAKGEVLLPSAEAGGSAPEPGADSAEAPDVVEGVAAEGASAGQTVHVELPVVWKEDGKAVAHFTFEFNDEVIGIHQPEESWHSGRHCILLYYPVEGVVANYRNVFNVYMRVCGGSARVDAGGCLASVSGQSMGAGEAWDGEIRIGECIGKAVVSGGLRVAVVGGGPVFEIDETVRRGYSDMMRGRAAIGAFGRPVEREA